MKLSKKVIITFFLSVFIFYYVSGLATANPVAVPYDPMPFILLGFLMLFIINLPINSIIYFGLLYLILNKKSKKEIFQEFPSIFIERVLLVIILATLFGALIDSILIFDIAIFFIIGLPLIFISYFLLIIYIQKLKMVDALKIGFGILIINGLSWLIIFLITILINPILSLLLFYIICIIVFIICFNRLRSWYNTNFFSLRKDDEKKIRSDLFKKSERILASINNAQTVLKEISIFFTNRQIIITKKGLSGKLDEILKSQKIITQISYKDIIYIHFKLSFLNNDLVIKTSTKSEEYYCNREELIIAKYELKKYLPKLIVT